MSVENSLWPVEVSPEAPEPVKVLQEQGLALSELTHGRLYGEVLSSDVASDEGVPYDFFVGVADKPFRYLLLSIRCGYSAIYPVKIVNSIAGSITQVSDVATFKKVIGEILKARPTQQLLSHLSAV